MSGTTPNDLYRKRPDAGGRGCVRAGEAGGVELVLRLLDPLAKVEGTYAPTRAEVSGTDDGPIEGRIDVMHWTPDDAFLARYARVLKEAGLLDEDEVEEARLANPGPSDPEV